MNDEDDDSYYYYYYFKMVDLPPSTGNIVPVTHDDKSLSNKYMVAAALSLGVPNRLIGCALAMAVAIFSFRVMEIPILDSLVKLGATQFTRIC